MNYVMLVCSDGVPTPEKSAAMTDAIDPWLEDVVGGAKHLYGHRLGAPDTARTVRVRAGRTLVSDGPFAEAKEFVAGFDLLRFRDREEAVSAAAKHPVSWFHSLELRPIRVDHVTEATREPAGGLFNGPPVGSHRFAIFICLDGSPGVGEDEADVTAEAFAWGDRVRAAGISPFTAGLDHPDTATTVRVRDGATIISDGPFVETKEFLAGLVLADLPSLEDAVALAAEHPVARLHQLEVRPFLED